MSDIIIKSQDTSAKISAYKTNIETKIQAYNALKSQTLKHCLKNSRGETVKRIGEQIEKEKNLIDSVSYILLEILDYIELACDDFMQLDAKYANQKIQS